MRHKAFICHSSSDKSFVRRLVADLGQRAIDVWFDEKEILVGDRTREKIEHGLSASDYLVVILSPESINSLWVTVELDAKLIEEIESRQVIVLPCLLADCNLPPLLKGKHYADFRSDYNRGLEDLLARFTNADRESEAKRTVVRTLNEIDPHRLDSHALVQIALGARELEAAEELIEAHRESVPACDQMLAFHVMLNDTRFLRTRDSGDYVTALDSAYQLAVRSFTPHNLNILIKICCSAPAEPSILQKLLEYLDHAVRNVESSGGPDRVTAFLSGVNRASLADPQRATVCEHVLKVLDASISTSLRRCLAQLLNVSTHVAFGHSNATTQKNLLRQIYNSAHSKVSDAREYSDAFLHLAWIAALIGQTTDANRWLSKYRLTVTTEVFDHSVRCHEPLASLRDAQVPVA